MSYWNAAWILLVRNVCTVSTGYHSDELFSCHYIAPNIYLAQHLAQGIPMNKYKLMQKLLFAVHVERIVQWLQIIKFFFWCLRIEFDWLNICFSIVLQFSLHWKWFKLNVLSKRFKSALNFFVSLSLGCLSDIRMLFHNCVQQINR